MPLISPEACAVCSAPITRETEPEGVIYSRLHIDGRWVSAPVCTADFLRVKVPPPHRIVWHLFDEL